MSIEFRRSLMRANFFQVVYRSSNNWSSKGNLLTWRPVAFLRKWTRDSWPVSALVWSWLRILTFLWPRNCHQSVTPPGTLVSPVTPMSRINNPSCLRRAEERPWEMIHPSGLIMAFGRKYYIRWLTQRLSWVLCIDWYDIKYFSKLFDNYCRWLL